MFQNGAGGRTWDVRSLRGGTGSEKDICWRGEFAVRQESTFLVQSGGWTGQNWSAEELATGAKGPAQSPTPYALRPGWYLQP